MEQTNFKRTLVTAALPYANGGVHIGHLAGVYVPADIYVRYMRLKKRDVLFVCGSDEHGVPITLRAKKEGCTPQDVCDRFHKIIKDSFAEFGISFDIYSRTTSETHRKVASDFFRTLTTKAHSWKKKASSIMTKKPRLFSPTDTLPVNARTVITKKPTETNANIAAPRSRPTSLSIPTAQLAAPSPY